LGAPLAGLAAGKSKGIPATCRDHHLKEAGTPDCWSAMKAIGVSGVELTVDEKLACPALLHPTKKYSLDAPDNMRALKDDMAQAGAAFPAILMHNRFDERLEDELAWMKKLVKVAPEIGVDVIRIDVVSRKIKGDEFLPFAIKTCKQLCEVAQGTPIRYGIENHGATTNDPAFLEKLFDGVGSPKLGLTLDTGNFYWFGHPLDDIYKICEKFGRRVFHTHCKSIKYPDDQKNQRRKMGWEYAKYTCPVYEGDVDYKRVVTILRRAKYAGDLCIEDESLRKFPENERLEVLRKEVAWLKKAQA
jgi:sugar phosphate isomerase/epimerase